MRKHSLAGTKKKSEQLGMSFGKARNRLVRMLLFHLAQQLGQTICFRCGKEILSYSDLSIEHKQSWQNISVSLFWDLDNIAFSHCKCNLPNLRNKPGKRGPEETAWCSKCKKFKATICFNKNKSRWNGFSSNCKLCRREE
jgi:hypothetical protein